MNVIDPTIPLIDLHRHIEGSIRIETVLELAQQHNLQLPGWDIASLSPYIKIMNPQPGVMAFIAKIELVVSTLADYAACQRVAYENVEDAQAEGLDYVELRFSPHFMAEPHKLDPVKVVGAIIDGVNSASENSGMLVNLIGIISRTYGPDIANQELAALLAHKEDIVGIDLAGDEAKYPGELFVDHMNTAREVGWHVTIHAGESSGPESVWQAIKGLGAERIGHGVNSVDDPALMDYLRETGISIETNLTSNVQTSTVPDYPSHPLRVFLESGIKATINTDDPRISDINIQYEYEVAAPAAGLSSQQIHQAQRNALEAAFLSSDQKMELLQNSERDGSP